MEAVLRILLPVHRYLGVVVGIVMTLWCLSGFVMMYQGFPNLSEEDRVAGLPALDLDGCCALDRLLFDDGSAAADFRVEMLGDRPVLRIQSGPGIYDLRTGEAVGELTEADARAAVAALRASRGQSTEPASVRVMDRIDQWTLQHFRRWGPFWRVDYAVPAGTSFYVSQRTGEVVQETTLKTRTLAWLGAIPHWLYPTILRQNGPLWSQVVVWASIIGIFLTVTGLVIGFARLKGRSGRWFPYRRVWLWHHAAGVFFGVLTLTWTFSGLLTMDPWGAFTSSPPVGQAEIGGSPTWGEAKALLAAAPAIARSGDLRQLRTAPIAGEPYLVATAADGAEARFAANGSPAPLTADGLQTALRGQGGALARAFVSLQEAEDAYYYGHKSRPPLPVLRAALADPASTVVYFSPTTGDVITMIDDVSRQSRWLESGLHSFDFPVLRWRPAWDVLVVLLLAGVTAVCATGTWLAIQRVRRDLTPGVRFRRDPRQVSAE